MVSQCCPPKHLSTVLSLHTLHTLYNVYFALNFVECILYSIHCTLHSIHCTLHMPPPSQPLCIVESTIYTAHCQPQYTTCLASHFFPCGANLSKFSLLTQHLPPQRWYCHRQQCTQFCALCVVHHSFRCPFFALFTSWCGQ